MSWSMRFTYDAVHDCVHAEFKDVVLQDEADAERWRKEVSTRLATFGRKIDLVINLTGLVVRPKAGPAFGRHRAEVLRQYTHRSFRHGGDDSTRTSIFTSSVLHGAGANVYPTREEAVAALVKARSNGE